MSLKRFLVLFLTMMLLGLSTSYAHAIGWRERISRKVEPPLSKYFFGPLESTLGNFTLGSYLFDPIEERIPKLDISGLIRNRTWNYTHGPTGNVGIIGAPLRGYRPSRKNDFAMVEWLAELEGKYRFTPDLSITSIFNFRYDSVFDWDKNWGSGFADDVETELGYYRDTKQILRELYLDYSYKTNENGSWHFRIGKQQVGLGKQDFNVIDIINQQFVTQSIVTMPRNLEWDRTPVWMWNMSYIFPARLIPNLSLKFLWIPDFEPATSNHVVGAASFPFEPPPPGWDWEGKRKYKDWSIGGSEWAVNLNYILKGWDFGLWYLSDWQESPVAFRRGSAARVERRHTRRESFMWGVDKTFYLWKRFWNFKIEQRLTMNEYLPNLKETIPTFYNPYLRDPGAIRRLAGQLAAGKDGFKKTNFLYSGPSLNTWFFKGDLNVLVALLDGWRFKYEEKGMLPLGIKRHMVFLGVYAFTYWFGSFEDKISIGYTGFQAFNDPGFDYRGRMNLDYKISDYTYLIFEYNFMTGERDGFHGRFEDSDAFRLLIEHHF